jgi:16S rRNA (cytosine1402-N4)-methyltransferase
MAAPRPGERVLDCTFGGGGHTAGILRQTNCYVLGIDRDPDANARAEIIKEQFKSRFDFEHMKFSEIGRLVEKHDKFDVVLFDLGLSSFQLDDADRGFSFMHCAKLDMRMSMEGESAYDIVNGISRKELSTVIDYFGDDPKASRIARAIDEARVKKPIETTWELADIVRSVYKLPPGQRKNSRTDAATKTFQAIRNLVNCELLELNRALENVVHIINNNARIITITFQGLEGRIIKCWAKSMKVCITPINKTVIRPSRQEIATNPRARSAILRGFVYTDDARVRSVGEGIQRSE